MPALAMFAAGRLEDDGDDQDQQAGHPDRERLGGQPGQVGQVLAEMDAAGSRRGTSRASPGRAGRLAGPAALARGTLPDISASRAGSSAVAAAVAARWRRRASARAVLLARATIPPGWGRSRTRRDLAAMSAGDQVGRHRSAASAIAGTPARLVAKPEVIAR